MQANFITTFRVYYEDTDAGGIVYYANYLKFAERARTEYFRSLGCSVSAIAKQYSVQLVVASCNSNYKYPARLEDEIEVHTSVVELARTFIDLHQDIYIKHTNVLATQQQVRLACVDVATIKPTAIPQDVLIKLQTNI
jgi:acyl-CoA thioester hydrolase